MYSSCVAPLVLCSSLASMAATKNGAKIASYTSSSMQHADAMPAEDLILLGQHEDESAISGTHLGQINHPYKVRGLRKNFELRNSGFLLSCPNTVRRTPDVWSQAIVQLNSRNMRSKPQHFLSKRCATSCTPGIYISVQPAQARPPVTTVAKGVRVHK